MLLGQADGLLAVLDAWNAAVQGQWNNVITIATRPATYHGMELMSFVEKPAARYLVAEAHQMQGRPDSAASYYEYALSPLRTDPITLALRGISSSFIHHRLVLVYAGMGRLDDARRHWEIFRHDFTDLDPEVRYLVEEARAALANVEAMATRGEG
jgi:hypothetical protein